MQQLQLGLLLVAMGPWLACGPSEGEYFRRVTELSGPNAADCGRVPVKGDLSGALACMERQFAGNQPFRVSVETYGLESILTFSVVRTPKGEVLAVVRDPDTCGGNCWVEKARIWVGPCAVPRVAFDPDGSYARDPIRCDSPDA